MFLAYYIALNFFFCKIGHHYIISESYVYRLLGFKVIAVFTLASIIL